jgi:hypothetical protein
MGQRSILEIRSLGMQVVDERVLRSSFGHAAATRQIVAAGR